MNRISTTQKPSSPNINWQGRNPQPDKQDDNSPQAEGDSQFQSQSQSVPAPSAKRSFRKKLALRQIVRSTGTLGMAVVIPTTLGMATGVWVDTLWPNTHSWFAILGPVGFGLGCLCAVFWSVVDQNS